MISTYSRGGKERRLFTAQQQRTSQTSFNEGNDKQINDKWLGIKKERRFFTVQQQRTS
jgi:hypothetical protein